MLVPAAHRWLFWDVDPDAIQLERDIRYVLARVLERGRLADVRWAVGVYGLDAVHDFFRSGVTRSCREQRLACGAPFSMKQECMAEPDELAKNQRRALDRLKPAVENARQAAVREHPAP